MNAAKELYPTKSEVAIRTQNPVHECAVQWTIDNATKFSRRLYSTDFPSDSECQPRFRLVAKFHEKYPNVCNVNIGIQRTDDSNEQLIHMYVDVSLLNCNSDVYDHKTLNYTILPNSSPMYCFSELFSSDPSKMTFPTSLAYDDKSDLVDFKRKGLLASYKHEKRVFILPNDVLIVKGAIKSYGCCVVTEELPSPKTQNEFNEASHVAHLLEDLKKSYENRELTDVELKIGDDTIHSHRLVLCLRSPVFRKMFEHETQEKLSGTVHIADIEKPVFESFMWYLYTGTVKEESWDFMCALCAAADRYEVFPLRTACASILTNLIDKYTVCEILKVAELCNENDLKRNAMEFIIAHFYEIEYSEEWKEIIDTKPNLASEILLEVSSKCKLLLINNSK